MIDYFSKFENLNFITSFNLLSDFTQQDMIYDVLVTLSSLCRKADSVYPAISKLNILYILKSLIDNCDSTIKSRACNLLGNMCRHSDYFYDSIKNANLAESLIKCCYDEDNNTRKFAYFALS